MTVESFRSEFPVVGNRVYMNAGTDGPIPTRGPEAARRAVQVELERGRAGREHFDRMMERRAALRERLARLFGCAAAELALTRSTTDGINTALQAMDLRSGDEVLTTDEEHPGVLGPLALAARRGVRVRVVPWEDLAGAATSSTRLIVCSHVSWVSGRVADTEALRETGVPLVYDGAQGAGAVPVDVGALGCDFYAASGQKWLCGPDATGYLYVRRERAEDALPPWPGYMTIVPGSDPLALEPAEGAARFDMGVSANGSDAWAAAAFDVLDEAGFERVHERAAVLAARLAGALADRGREVAPRGRTTLVAWRSGDAEADVLRLAEQGIVVRHLPGRGLVRASVGAWATEEEVDRVAALA